MALDLKSDSGVAGNNEDENSGVGAPRLSAENRSAFRRLFYNDQILLPSFVLAMIAALECFVCTWFFDTFGMHKQVFNVMEGQEDGNGNVYFQLDKTPFLVAASLASFMVVFRAQICYNRWWEGRTHVGGINKCLKQLLLLTSSDELVRIRTNDSGENSARLLFACLACIIQQLWGDDDMEPMRELLSMREFKMLQKSTVNRPLLIIHWLTEPLRNIRGSAWEHDDARRHAMWAEVSQLVEHINSALKVAYTPIPNDYHVATRFILYAFCFANPVCLAWYHPEYPSMAVSVVASAIITGLFFVVSFVSEDLENPFCDALCLPLDNMLVRYYHEIDTVTHEGWDTYEKGLHGGKEKNMNVAENLARAHVHVDNKATLAKSGSANKATLAKSGSARMGLRRMGSGNRQRAETTTTDNGPKTAVAVGASVADSQQQQLESKTI
jgi:predicted membrane chloride channel (bestrophin family)